VRCLGSSLNTNGLTNPTAQRRIARRRARRRARTSARSCPVASPAVLDNDYSYFSGTTSILRETVSWGGARTPPGGSFLGNGSLTLQLIERTSVTVPAGTFPDCLHLRLTSTAGDSTKVQDYWWALGVGKVRNTRISGYEADMNNGGYLQELVSYVIPTTPTPTLTPSTTPSRTPTPSCAGDCDGRGTVTVDEILTMVNIALGNAPVTTCEAGDANHDGQITIDEILTAVNNALNGCGGG